MSKKMNAVIEKKAKMEERKVKMKEEYKKLQHHFHVIFCFHVILLSFALLQNDCLTVVTSLFICKAHNLQTRFAAEAHYR